MIDAPEALRAYLASQAALTALTTPHRIWAERTSPVAGYAPAMGGAIAFRVRGGDVTYMPTVASLSVQFKCYGRDEQGANAVYRALFDVLHNKSGGALKSAFIEVLGQTLNEPGTTPPWSFVLTFYTVWLGV